MRAPAAAAATPDAGTRATPPGGQVGHHVVRTPHSAATPPPPLRGHGLLGSHPYSPKLNHRCKPGVWGGGAVLLAGGAVGGVQPRPALGPGVNLGVRFLAGPLHVSIQIPSMEFRNRLKQTGTARNYTDTEQTEQTRPK